MRKEKRSSQTRVKGKATALTLFKDAILKLSKNQRSRKTECENGPEYK